MSRDGCVGTHPSSAGERPLRSAQPHQVADRSGSAAAVRRSALTGRYAAHSRRPACAQNQGRVDQPCGRPPETHVGQELPVASDCYQAARRWVRSSVRILRRKAAIVAMRALPSADGYIAPLLNRLEKRTRNIQKAISTRGASASKTRTGDPRMNLGKTCCCPRKKNAVAKNSAKHIRQRCREMRCAPEIPPRRITLRSKAAANAAKDAKTK